MEKTGRGTIFIPHQQGTENFPQEVDDLTSRTYVYVSKGGGGEGTKPQTGSKVKKGKVPC